MATTANYDTNGTLNGPGEAWLKISDGATTTACFLQARGGALEWCEAPTASAPSASLAGHDIKAEEQQALEALAASQSYYIRALTTGYTKAVVTPGTAAA